MRLSGVPVRLARADLLGEVGQVAQGAGADVALPERGEDEGEVTEGPAVLRPALPSTTAWLVEAGTSGAATLSVRRVSSSRTAPKRPHTSKPNTPSKKGPLQPANDVHHVLRVDGDAADPQGRASPPTCPPGRSPNLPGSPGPGERGAAPPSAGCRRPTKGYGPSWPMHTGATASQPRATAITATGGERQGHPAWPRQRAPPRLHDPSAPSPAARQAPKASGSGSLPSCVLGDDPAPVAEQDQAGTAGQQRECQQRQERQVGAREGQGRR
jgi:hypothetical protein